MRLIKDLSCSPNHAWYKRVLTKHLRIRLSDFPPILTVITCGLMQDPLIEAWRQNHATTCRADAAFTENTSSQRSGSRTLPTASLPWAWAKSSVRLTEGVVRRGGLHMCLLISHHPNHTTASISNSWWTTWLRPPRAGWTGGEWAPHRPVGGEGLGDVCIRKTARLGWYVDTRTHADLLSLPTGVREAHLTAAGIPEVFGETGGLGEKVLWTKDTNKCLSVGYFVSMVWQTGLCD